MPTYGPYTLEPSSLDLLRDLFETHQEHGRDPIFAFQTMGVEGLQFKPSAPAPSGIFSEVDLNDLAANRLISVTYGSRGTPRLAVTAIGMDFVREHLLEAAKPVETAEAHVLRYVDSARFAELHPEAVRELRQGLDLLWADDVAERLTEIGHHAREALQAFATDLAESSGDSELQALGVQQTVAKVRGVLDQRRARVGETVQAHLEALLGYWGTVNDLAQRQEHGAAREGEPLTVEDAQRTIFQTALVMYELHRAIET